MLELRWKGTADGEEEQEEGRWARGARQQRLAAVESPLTAKTEQEHAFVVLVDGRRVIVTGGADGINFENMQLRGIGLHSHPPGSLPGASAEDIAFIEEYFQKSSWLLEVEVGASQVESL